MKKILALIMAVIMSFSVALVPAYAADGEAETEQVTVDDVFNAIETTVKLIMDTIEQVHNIVGQILGVLEKECPMCGVIHELATEGDGEVVEDEVVEDEVVEDEVVEEEVTETTEALAA